MNPQLSLVFTVKPDDLLPRFVFISHVHQYTSTCLPCLRAGAFNILKLAHIPKKKKRRYFAVPPLGFKSFCCKNYYWVHFWCHETSHRWHGH